MIHCRDCRQTDCRLPCEHNVNTDRDNCPLAAACECSVLKSLISDENNEAKGTRKQYCIVRTLTNLPGISMAIRSVLTIGWTFSLAFLLFLLSPTPSHAEHKEPCNFPSDWTGTWFLKGASDPIRISGNEISDKGLCKEISGDKFLVENVNEKCVRCMVINEKHPNVLQYKETYCVPSNKRHHSLKEVCSEINGDAQLFSLFRLDTPPVKCPFEEAPYKFSYNSGRGECREPLSSIDSCTDDAHLLFRFQACADVDGTESRVEELECFGHWKDGSVRYLVGKVDHNTAKTDQDKFRCFVFDKMMIDDASGKSSYQIAQSGDATCDGIFSPTEGSRTMKLSSTDPVTPSCFFPSWLSGQRHWQTLDRSQVYDFSKNNTFRVFNATSGTVIRTATCTREESYSAAYHEFVVHSVSGCQIGYTCIRIYKRTEHVIEIEGGNHLTKNKNDACYPHYYSSFLTLTTFSPHLKACPFDGVYALESPGEDETLWTPPNDKSLFICSEQSVLMSRCNSAEHMAMRSRCSSSSDETKNFYCHGGWKENSSNYLIVSSNEDKMHYCINYDLKDGRVTKLSINSVTCPRLVAQIGIPVINYNQPQTASISFNLIDQGMCHSASAASGDAHHIIPDSFMLNFYCLFLLYKTLF
ncbi:hypothetical protein HDE_08733 [Halotydeus destructor]|nr:hypothetical protein HDE_08733 [Halotydeus destructor]